MKYFVIGVWKYCGDCECILEYERFNCEVSKRINDYCKDGKKRIIKGIEIVVKEYVKF
jgi:hypothetical protein